MSTKKPRPPKFAVKLSEEVEAVADIRPALLAACLRGHALSVDWEGVRAGSAFVSWCPYGGVQRLALVTRYLKRSNTFVTSVEFD